MRIGILGVNHKSAEIGLRERVSNACQKKLPRESALAEKFNCIVLSTCNRTEIYFSAEDLADAHSILLNALREEIDTPFEHKMYSYFGLDCFLHLAQVTSGLDSVIIAESEIQRQVKLAYEQSQLYFSLPSCMHFLFQKCLKLGKEIRTKSTLAQGQVGISKTLFALSAHLLKNVLSLPILFVGNSDINRKVISHFRKKGAQHIALCTRSPFSAQAMAEKEGIELLSWEDIHLWQNYPIVVCATKSSGYVIQSAGEEIKTRLIFDLSVPRNVNPQLVRHPALSLFNMEEMSQMLELEQNKNLSEIDRAESLLFDRVQSYILSFQNKELRAYQWV